MCQSAGCSHLCLLVPAGVYCACPDHTHVQQGVSEKICDAGNYNLYVLDLHECDIGNK